MSEAPDSVEAAEVAKKEGKRARFGRLLSDGWSSGKEKSVEGLMSGWEKGKEMSSAEFVKGKLALQHAVGLGAQPNVIPPGEASVDGELRVVEIGWHPVPGLASEWFAKNSLGKMITKNIGTYPDPTQHWAVLVGDYVHQLWMDESLDVIYINQKLDREMWKTYDVGKTRFTDEALRQAAVMVIHQMRETRPAYNVISNNCQNYAVNLLDAIQIGAHKEFATSFAVYQAATGDGTIKELFVDKHPEEQKLDIAQSDASLDPAQPRIHRTDTVQNAQHVMDENTTKVDNHRKFWS